MHKILFKKYYFIEKFYKSNIDKQAKNTIIIYRNYKKKIDLSEILNLKQHCKNKGFKLLISNNIKLALKLNLDGAYLPAFNKSYQHLSYNYKKKFLLVGSAHKLNEIRNKEKQGVSEIFISSIFKKNNNFLGINKFKLISNLTKKKVVALGGVSAENINQLKLLNNPEFAGISYFE